MRRLELWFECGEKSLRVRSFSVHEGLSEPFAVSIRALDHTAMAAERGAPVPPASDVARMSGVRQRLASMLTY